MDYIDYVLQIRVEEQEELCDLVHLTWGPSNGIYNIREILEGRVPIPTLDNRFDLVNMDECGMMGASIVLGIEAGKQIDQIERRHSEKDFIFWERFRREFFELACLSSSKYADLRKMLPSGQKSQLAITSAVASAIATHIGVTAGIFLTPLVAIGALFAIRFGRQEMCRRLGELDILRAGYLGVSVREIREYLESKKTAGKNKKL